MRWVLFLFFYNLWGMCLRGPFYPYCPGLAFLTVLWGGASVSGNSLLCGSVCLSLCQSRGVLITVALSWVWYLVAQVCQTCSLFSRSSWLFLVPSPFHINFVSACQFPPTINLLWFWLRLHWVQILVGGKEHVYSIVVSQSMNMVCSSICLDPC